MTRLGVVETIARDIIEDFPSTRVYHDESHVESVVSVARELSVAEGLSPHERELLLTAAWFHDLGYANGPADGHEQRSIAFAKGKLSDIFSEDELERIASAISATEWPQSPTTTLGRVLADADVHTLGTDEAVSARLDVFKELRQTKYPCLTRDDFLEARVEMFDGYTFHTNEGRRRYQETFETNLDDLKSQVTTR